MNDQNPVSSQGQKGFRNVLIALIIFVAMVIAGGLILKQHSDPKAITTYAQCAQAKGSVILQTYPTICTTKDKKSFTNPEQQHVCGYGGYATNPSTCSP